MSDTTSHATPTLESSLVRKLAEQGLTLALAESCTGGLVAARVTAVPGASAVFHGGVIAYHNDVKRDLLQVPAAVLESAGAVSPEAALAMAQGVRRLLHASLAAAITGIAGPGGGTSEKPVGLVFVAVSGPSGERVKRFLFPGKRDAIRLQAADAALRMLLSP
ncbi:MAG: CinA family protein, partial [bacterium]